jgi:Methylase involved in ubiquinone/menaquinone biosynthesis
MGKDESKGATLYEMINAVYWYHVIDLGNGIVTPGDYDLRPLIDKYGIPQDLTGKDVLDVGRASGFFSFEFERRGARVVATDLPSFFDWDFVGGHAIRVQRRASIGNQKSYDKVEIFGAFDIAHKILNSEVESVLINVYNMSPAAFGEKTFDIIFVGSLLSHLKDPILALEKIYSVTKEKIILSSPILDAHNPLPLMCLVGTADSDRRSWWLPNLCCLMEMLRCVGYKKVEAKSTFHLENLRVKDLRVFHAVVHGAKQ